MVKTVRTMHVMHAPVPAAAALRQPLVGWRRCAKNMHDPKGLLDTRSASPRAPASIAAVGLEGILSEASSASSRTSKNPNARNIEKSCQNENVKPAFKGGPEPLEKEIHEILGSKCQDRFPDPFFIEYKILVWFVFRTCFACAISVRPRGTCESSRRSARR